MPIRGFCRPDGAVVRYGPVEWAYLERLLGTAASELLALSADLLEVARSHFFSGIGYGLRALALAGLV